MVGAAAQKLHGSSQTLKLLSQLQPQPQGMMRPTGTPRKLSISLQLSGVLSQLLRAKLCCFPSG